MILEGHVHSFMRDRPPMRPAIRPIVARTDRGRAPAGLFTDNCGRPAPCSLLALAGPPPRLARPFRSSGSARRRGTGRQREKRAPMGSPHRRENSREGPSNFRGGGRGRPRPGAYIGGCFEGNHGPGEITLCRIANERCGREIMER